MIDLFNVALVDNAIYLLAFLCALFLGCAVFLQRQVAGLRQQLQQLQGDYQVAQMQSVRVPVLEHEVQMQKVAHDEAQHRIQQINLELVRAQEKNLHLQQVQETVRQREDELAKVRFQLNEEQIQVAELTTKLTEQQQQAADKLQLLSQSRVELSNQFKTLAQEIFEEKGRIFSAKNGEHLHQVLEPFRDQLQDFKKKVDDIYVNDVRERGSLKVELENLRQINVQMNREAMNLTRALKGDKKAQGNWGELVLERVLEQSGLRAGVEYEAQGAFRDADKKLLKPDVIIHLPENKDVVVDSKVSLVAYERYCNEEDSQLQAQALSDHVAAVRQHITELSAKDYTGLQGVRSLDFVLLFMPIEASFMAAFQADDNLFNHAFERRIVVVTPTTLLATLRTIENIWRYERQNQNTQAIAERAGAVYDKLRGFVDDMEKLGVQLATVDNTYQGAMAKLTQGRGNLISQANHFVELGVKVRKPLSKSVLERADLETSDDVS
ncbi:MAG: DNA recombination protein RmuC [Desulfuromonas sp.]|nr:DNA recombination protein RmuC [Desulfuromonas sp.]